MIGTPIHQKALMHKCPTHRMAICGTVSRLGLRGNRWNNGSPLDPFDGLTENVGAFVSAKNTAKIPRYDVLAPHDLNKLKARRNWREKARVAIIAEDNGRTNYG